MSEYQWAYSLVDSSRVSTFLISILLIVYGSFRSLNMEQEAKEKEKERSLTGLSGSGNSAETSEFEKKERKKVFLVDLMIVMYVKWLRKKGSTSGRVFIREHAPVFTDPMLGRTCICGSHGVFGCSNSGHNAGVVSSFGGLHITSRHVLFLRLDADVIRSVHCHYCHYSPGLSLASHVSVFNSPLLRRQQNLIRFLRPFYSGRTHVFLFIRHNRVHLGVNWTLATYGCHGDGVMCGVHRIREAPEPQSFYITFDRFAHLRHFLGFFSSYIFNANVMVKVATRPAENPVGVVAKKLHLGLAKEAPKLSLPGKLVFPSMHNSGHFSMLGLGDIVMPGLLLCFVLRYDAYKKNQISLAETGVPPPNHLNKISYFHCSLIGYFLGLLTATVSSEVFKAAQPALLYLVPFTLLPLLTMAYIKGDLRRMWSEPFIVHAPSKHLDV
uniref:Signal peptide peptidase-like 3 n=1 Tax=Strigamia maritima TaxID=126957 RepID=T1J5D8_STRMM